LETGLIKLMMGGDRSVDADQYCNIVRGDLLLEPES
jgi:hypothetical protein